MIWTWHALKVLLLLKISFPKEKTNVSKWLETYRKIITCQQVHIQHYSFISISSIPTALKRCTSQEDCSHRATSVKDLGIPSPSPEKRMGRLFNLSSSLAKKLWCNWLDPEPKLLTELRDSFYGNRLQKLTFAKYQPGETVLFTTSHCLLVNYLARLKGKRVQTG
jgi:hypothetical protein